MYRTGDNGENYCVNVGQGTMDKIICKFRADKWGGLIHQFRTGDSGGNQSAIIGQGIPQKTYQYGTGKGGVRQHRIWLLGENRFVSIGRG